MKKKSFTLIEILISLSLLSLLLGALFGAYRFVTVEQKSFLKLEKPFLEKHYLDVRLSKIFKDIPANFHFLTSKTDQHIINDTSLVFIFDHGVDKDCLHSGPVLARLYLDRTTNALSLAIWPHPHSCPKEWREPPTYPQVLMENVKKVDFRFYYPRSKNTVDPEQVGKNFPRGGWQDHWFDEYRILPTFIEMTLKKEDEEKPLVYLFETSFSPFINCKGGV